MRGGIRGRKRKTMVTLSWLMMIVLDWRWPGWNTSERKTDWDFVKEFECQCEDFTFNLVGQGEPPDVCA